MEEPVQEAPTPDAPRAKRGPVIAAAIGGALLFLILLAYFLSPRISVAGFEIVQTRDTHFVISLKLAVQNRLPLDIRVGGYEFFLDVNGDQLGHTLQQDPTEIPALETTHVPISVEGFERDLPDWLQMGRRMAPTKRDYEYHFHGWIQLVRPFGFRYEFDTDGKFPGFAMPDMVFEQIAIARMNLFNPAFDLAIRFMNANPVEITHREFVSDVFVNGVQVATVSKDDPVTYEPNSERVETFRFDMESVRGASAMMRVVLAGGEVMLRLKGSVIVSMPGYGEFPFEFDKEGPAPIQLTGMFGGGSGNQP